MKPLSLAALAALALASCRNLPSAIPDVPPQVEGGATAQLARLNPNDIVVAPVEFAAEGVTLPGTILRTAAADALVAHRYAPLSVEFVDGTLPPGAQAGVMEASYRPGTLGEDAVLRTVVHQWDTSNWRSRRSLTVDLEFVMESPSSAQGVLWTARCTRRFDLANEVRLEVNEPARWKAACDAILAWTFSGLPDREVQALAD
jgi:hypothetical protein